MVLKLNMSPILKYISPKHEQPAALKAVKRRQQKARRKSRKILKAIHERNLDNSSYSSSDSCGENLDEFRETTSDHVETEDERSTENIGATNISINDRAPLLRRTLGVEHDQSWEGFEDLAEFLNDEDSDIENENLRPTLVHLLSQWAVEYNITLSALTKLLKILRDHNVDVPADGRTLLKTPRSGSITVTEKSGMIAKPHTRF